MFPIFEILEKWEVITHLFLSWIEGGASRHLGFPVPRECPLTVLAP